MAYTIPRLQISYYQFALAISLEGEISFLLRRYYCYNFWRSDRHFFSAVISPHTIVENKFAEFQSDVARVLLFVKKKKTCMNLTSGKKKKERMGNLIFTQRTFEPQSKAMSRHAIPTLGVTFTPWLGIVVYYPIGKLPTLEVIIRPPFIWK